MKDFFDLNDDGRISREDFNMLAERYMLGRQDRAEKHILVPVARALLAGLAVGMFMWAVVRWLWLYQFGLPVVLNHPSYYRDFGLTAGIIVACSWLVKELYNNSEGPRKRAITAAYDKGQEDGLNANEARIHTLEEEIRALKRMDAGAGRNLNVQHTLDVYRWFIKDLYSGVSVSRATFCKRYPTVTQSQWQATRNRMISLSIMNDNGLPIMRTESEAMAKINDIANRANAMLDEDPSAVPAL